MKRLIYIAFMAVLMLAACTKRQIDLVPQVPESSRSYIFFEPEVIETSVTKATLLEGKTLHSATNPTPSFGVIGYCGTYSLFGAADGAATSYKYAKGIAQVTYSATEGVYSYNKLALWQDNMTDHDFYAFYPYDLSASVKHSLQGSTAVKPHIEYTQPTANDNSMVDILTAKASTKKTDNVDLEFHHRLWALYVQINNAQTEGLTEAGSVTDQPTMKITEVKVIVENFPTAAYIYMDKSQGIDYVKKNNQVALSTTPSTYTMSVPASGDIIAKNGSKTYGPLLFLPVAAGVFKYKLEIKYVDSRNVSLTHATALIASKTAFEGGKKYTLIVNKTNDAFVFGSYFDPDGDEADAFQPGDWSDTNVNHEFN